ncbi:MAG: hypothetical protein ACK5MK_15535 [Dysgonomonas sp.]
MNLNEIGNGGLQELFAHELDKVLKNIKDPNTDAKAKRTVTIKLEIKPDEQRMVGQVGINVSHTSAPIKGLATNILMEKTGAGVKFEEIGNQIPGQMGLDNIINMEDAK